MKPKLGNVIEFKTCKGLAYAVYTHRHAEYGELLKFIDGFYELRPASFESLLTRQVKFAKFIPLFASIKLNLVAIAGSIDIP